jgi:hypothetical protein
MDLVKNMSLYHQTTSLLFVYNKPEVKFMYSYNHTGRYRKELYSLTPQITTAL